MKKLLIFLLSVLVVSCSLAPAKKDIRSEQAIPDDFSAKSSSVTMNEIAPYKWWEVFGDSQLNDIIDKTVKNNLDVLLAVSRVELLEKQFSISRRLRFPMLSAKAGASYGMGPQMGIKKGVDPSTNQPTMDFGFSSKSTGTYTLNTGLSFELDLWGRLRSAEKSALSNLLATKEDLQTVYLSVISQVIILYFEIQELYELEKLNMELLGFTKTGYETAKSRYESGSGSVNETEQAFQQLENARSNNIDIKTKIASRLNAMSVLTGEMPQVKKYDLENGSKGLPISFEQVPAGLPSSILENRADIKSAEFKVEAARMDIGAARADLFPRISLTGVLGYINLTEFTNLFTSDYLTASIGGDINYSFAGGSKYAVVDQKKVLYEQSVLNYRKTVLNAFKEVEEAFLAVENADIQKESVKIRLESMERILNNAKERFKSGAIPYSQLIELEKTVISLKQIELSILKGVALSRVQLHRALGGNWLEE